MNPDSSKHLKLDSLSWEEFQKIKSSDLPFAYTEIVTGSMAPLIKPGDQILIDLKQKHFNPYDILVFWADQILVCHVLYKSSILGQTKTFLTTPLNGKNFDLPLKEEQILGLVVSHKLNFWQKIKLRYSLG